VKALVYVDAFMPDEGETTFGVLGDSGSALAVPDPTTVLDVVGYPGAPEGDADAYLSRTPSTPPLYRISPRPTGRSGIDVASVERGVRTTLSPAFRSVVGRPGRIEITRPHGALYMGYRSSSSISAGS
jgi:hypothetical protein